MSEDKTFSEDEELDRIWNENEGDQPRDERGRYATKEEEAAEAPETPVEAEAEEKAPEAEKVEEEATAPVVEAPSHLPRAIREVWADLPEAARNVIDENQQSYAKRLSVAEEYRRSLDPIHQRIQQARQDLPALANMQPEEIAAQVFELAQWSARLQSDPVGALTAIAAHRGVGDQLRAHFSGEPQEADPMAAMRAEMAEMRQQLAQRQQAPDIDAQVQHQMHVARLQGEVEAFAQSKADWGVLEPHIQAALPEQQAAHPDLSPIEVLELTYNSVANQLLHPLRSAAAESAVNAQKADAAKKAASVNVTPEGAGAPAPLSEDEEMDKIWAKHHS